MSRLKAFYEADRLRKNQAFTGTREQTRLRISYAGQVPERRSQYEVRELGLGSHPEAIFNLVSANPERLSIAVACRWLAVNYGS